MTNELSVREVAELETTVDHQIDKLEQLRFAIESAVQENDEPRARRMLEKLEQTEIELRGAFQDMRDLLLTAMHDVRILEEERDDAVNEAEELRAELRAEIDLSAELRGDIDYAYDNGYDAGKDADFHNDATCDAGVDAGYETALEEFDREREKLEARLVVAARSHDALSETLQNVNDALRAALAGDEKALAALRQWVEGANEDAA